MLISLITLLKCHQHCICQFAKEASDQRKLSEREQAIYNLICENKHLTVEQVMAEFDISRSTVFRDYAKIKKITGAVYDKNESLWKL